MCIRLFFVYLQSETETIREKWINNFILKHILWIERALWMTFIPHSSDKANNTKAQMQNNKKTTKQLKSKIRLLVSMCNIVEVNFGFPVECITYALSIWPHNTQITDDKKNCFKKWMRERVLINLNKKNDTKSEWTKIKKKKNS